MAESIYGTSVIPGVESTVRSGDTIPITSAFTSAVGIVGNSDLSNGSESANNARKVRSASQAEDLYGADSELTKNIRLAYRNGVEEVYAVAVDETEGTDSYTSTGSGTLSDAPVADPNVEPEHSIDVVDGASNSQNVEIVYDIGGDLTAPSASDDADVRVNPVTGEWAAEDGTLDYTFTYDYGDYTTAVDEIVNEDVRFVSVLVEDSDVGDHLVTQLDDEADNFQFKRGIIGAGPELADDATHNYDDQRLIAVPQSRGFEDLDETEYVRTMGALGGLLAGLPFDETANRESINGIESLNTTYTVSELGTLIDNQWFTLFQRSGDVKVVKDLTTSSDARFERVYATEITDEVTNLSFEVSEQYIGELNTQSERRNLRSDHQTFLDEMVEDNLLDGYNLNVFDTEGDENEVQIELGLDVVDVIDQISVEITVGDVVVAN